MKRLVPGLLLVPVLTFGQTPAAAPGALTLDVAIQEALNHNLDVAVQKYNITVAEARQITARLRPNPVLTLSSDHLDLLGTGYNATNAAGPAEHAARTDFILERGHKRDARIALAEADRSVAQLAFQDSVRRLIYDVASAFVDVQLAKENLALAEDNLRSLNGIVEVNAARVKSGDLAPVELSRSQVAALQYETAVKQAASDLKQAKNRLQLLLGRATPDGGFEISGELRRDAQPVILDAVRERALLQRPDLLNLRQSQARNRADLTLQLAQGKIDYTVGTEYRRQQGLAGTGNSLGFFFSAPLPVFNRNQGEIARAQREIDQAGVRVRALEANVNTEVANAWQQYETSRQLLNDIETNMIAKAKDVRQIMEYSYRRGEASLVEFLDAQRAANDAMQSYNQARANYARSLYLIDSVSAASTVNHN